MREQLDYLDQIRRRGYRVTPQRQLILDTLCQMGGHATPSELFRQVQPQMPSLNQATVYRVLDFLLCHEPGGENRMERQPRL